MDSSKIVEFIVDEHAYEIEIPILEKTDTEPYLKFLEVRKVFKYNPKYGDDRICECGHPYYRHFDTYEDMLNVGCKYCHGECTGFVEKKTCDGKCMKDVKVKCDGCGE